MTTEKKLATIGSTEYVEIAGIPKVPAKIDTGADSSAVWASDIEMKKDGTLIFSLFGKSSPFYTGERIETKDYRAKSVRSSLGDKQIRYRVKLPIKVKGEILETTFTLANRARNNFPILIGRRTLKDNFVVDVTKSEVEREGSPRSRKLNQELKKLSIKNLKVTLIN